MKEERRREKVAKMQQSSVANEKRGERKCYSKDRLERWENREKRKKKRDSEE